MQTPEEPERSGLRSTPYASYAHQVSLIVGILLAAVALIYFVGVVFHLLLFVFLGVLLAVFLRGIAQWITDKTPLGIRLSLALVFILALGSTVGLGWLMIPPLVEQIQGLAEEIPRAFQQIQESLEEYEWGRVLLRTFPDDPGALLGRPDEDMWAGLGALVGTTVGGVLNFVVFFVVAFSTAVHPQRYIQGIVLLVPPERRERAREVISILGQQLEAWLVARVITMIIIGIITAIGLWLFGMPMVLVLSVLAVFLEFIPVLGPILASIPAILIGLLISPLYAFYIAFFYWMVQNLESYLITPVLQHKIVKLAPALVIIAQLIMAVIL
ncbi:MAG: AI-2E family transporter, partial [Bradymonadaceae bacterium]